MKYKESGVNIDNANEATRSIRESAKKTWNENVLSDVGHFGGLFRLPDSIREPVLVSSMDGVGTKILVATRARRFDTVGQDLVNHCVNDILVQGAVPLFFLDYVAAGSLDPKMIAAVVSGLATACSRNGCALIGGETAEMPGVYHGDDFDLAGTIIGVVDRNRLLDGASICEGDVLFALPSNGLHTNGYSLVRSIVFDHLGLQTDTVIDTLGCTVADELLRIHRSYLHEVDDLRKAVDVRGLAHITGGGLVENLPRIMPGSLGARVHTDSWNVPAVFPWLEENGSIDNAEMYRVFNMGIGMIVVVAQRDEARVPPRVGNINVVRVGEVVSSPGVEIV